MKATTSKILEIQGLRALAATLVLIFHAKFISGGFIGVDIFYVISGFLITGLLLKELNATGRISLKAFYLRRSKRLLPASFLVLFVTALFAWSVLPPISRGSIGRDLIATTLYISNYLFAWWENDYQNLNSTPSPFIHYWSLAVEEQFYIFWPLFIIGLAKLKSARKFLIGFSLVTVITFALGVRLTIVAPIWAFYSLPTRAWELSVGALIALIPALRRQSRLLAVIGVIALGASALWFNESTAFPGTYALLPVLGTAALLSSIGAWPKLDTPLPKRNIPDCLSSTSADKCLADSKLGLPQTAKFEIIDPSTWLCSLDCPGIVRGNVAYRDASHISVATSLDLSDSLWRSLLLKGFTL